MKKPAKNPNAPLANKILVVPVPLIINEYSHGVYEAVEVENALEELKRVADESGRTITMVNFFVTTAAPGSGVVVTILIQWIGTEELARISRLQQIQSGQGGQGRIH